MSEGRHYQTAKKILQQGGVIAYPTEAVYGLGCDPFNEAAVKKILALKQRDIKKGLILVVSCWEQVAGYLKPLTIKQINRLEKKYNRPTTWLCPVIEQSPAWIRGEHKTVAIRRSLHPAVQRLCNTFGAPIVSTSANLAGQRSAVTAAEVNHIFSDTVDFVLAGRTGASHQVSQIRDLTTSKLIRA